MDTHTTKVALRMEALTKQQQELLTDAELTIDKLMDQAQRKLSTTAEEANTAIQEHAADVTRNLQLTHKQSQLNRHPFQVHKPTVLPSPQVIPLKPPPQPTGKM
jgi:hypothetical protein